MNPRLSIVFKLAVKVSKYFSTRFRQKKIKSHEINKIFEKKSSIILKISDRFQQLWALNPAIVLSKTMKSIGYRIYIASSTILSIKQDIMNGFIYQKNR